MNKIFKYSLGILTTCIGLLSLCNATIINSTENTITLNKTRQLIQVNSGELFCATKVATNTTIQDSLDGTNVNQSLQSSYLYCYDSDIYFKTTASSATIRSYTLDISNITGTCPTCPTCDDPYTSLECQTQYNLIPIESVTANYCHVNFGLIDPMDCPVGDGTGATQWSALYINQQQYAGNDNININIPNDISWSLDYNDDDTDIEIEGYNADQEYIENIIAQEKMTPTNEDFEYMIQSLSGFIPYLFIGLLIFFMVRIFNKIWK